MAPVEFAFSSQNVVEQLKKKVKTKITKKATKMRVNVWKNRANERKVNTKSHFKTARAICDMVAHGVLLKLCSQISLDDFQQPKFIFVFFASFAQFRVILARRKYALRLFHVAQLGISSTNTY